MSWRTVINASISWKHLPSTPPFFLNWAELISCAPRSQLAPHQWCRGAENEDYNQFITWCFCFSFLLGKNFSQSFPVAMWHPSQRWQSFMKFSCLPSDEPHQRGLPSESWTPLGSVSCVSIRGPPWSSDIILLHHWSLRAARAQPVILTQDEEKWLLWSSLSLVPTWLSFFCPTPPPNKRTSKTKEFPQKVFPFKISYWKGAGLKKRWWEAKAD